MYWVERELKDNAKRIDEALSKHLSECEIGIGKLADAMRYSVQNGGKRLRAFLTLEVCRMLGGNDEGALPYALAIEFGHAASLIHDDMPCMDDDDLRRGKPSCHIRFDEYTALLAGDALLSLAFETIITNSHLDAATNALAAKEFSHNVGVHGMCLGQQRDLDGHCETYQELLEMYELKTGLAIKVSMVLGCLAARRELDYALLEKISAYSKKVGIAFQIIDDLSDVYSTTEEIGKPVGSDAKNKKVTALTFLSKEKAEEAANELLDEAALVFEGELNSELLCAVPYYLKKRMGVQIGDVKLGAKALSCFEQVDSAKRYEFTKKVMEAADENELLNVLCGYGCAVDEKSFTELNAFLQNSKFVKYQKYKSLNRNTIISSCEKTEVFSNLKAADKKVVVVGAGIAGTSCAFLLKQAGYDVLLLERAALGNKVKLCGGILSDKSVTLLKHIYGDEVAGVFKQSMEDTWFFLDEKSSLNTKKPGYYTTVRKLLDDYALKRYIDIGGAVVEQIDIAEVDELKCTVNGTDQKNGERVSYRYDLLIAADGANSKIRKQLTGKGQETMLALEVDVPKKHDSFIMRPGAIQQGYYGYCWYIPQGDKANIGCGYAKKAGEKYFAAEVSEMRQELTAFAEQIGIDISQLSIKGARIPCAELHLQKGNIYFLGDAGGLVNTHTGEGIHYALASALLLRNAIVREEEYEKLMESVTTEIALINDSREEFYDILSMLIQS